jgi:hypothetical protein
VAVGAVGRDANGGAVIGDRRIDLALAEMRVATVAMGDGEIGIGHSGRANDLSVEPDGLVPLAALNRLPTGFQELGRTGARRQAEADEKCEHPR